MFNISPKQALTMEQFKTINTLYGLQRMAAA
jgi:hypothetical protein